MTCPQYRRHAPAKSNEDCRGKKWKLLGGRAAALVAAAGMLMALHLAGFCHKEDEKES